MNIANYLTAIRFVTSPLFLFIYVAHETLGISSIILPYILLLLLLLSELSDIFDGYLARKYNLVTDLGKILDPMADTLVHLSVFLTFTLDPVQLPIPWVFVFLYRDSIISILRTMCALKGVALAARTSGKIKTILQGAAAIAIVLFMIPYSLGYITPFTLHTAANWIVGITAIYTVFSGIEYLYANRAHVRKILKTS